MEAKGQESLLKPYLFSVCAYLKVCVCVCVWVALWSTIFRKPEALAVLPVHQHVLDWGGCCCLFSSSSFFLDPSLPRIPTRIAPARRAQKDGWILSINNQQSKARNHYVFLSMLCFKAPDSSLQKVAPVQMCWIHHMGR